VVVEALLTEIQQAQNQRQVGVLVVVVVLALLHELGVLEIPLQYHHHKEVVVETGMVMALVAVAVLVLLVQLLPLLEMVVQVRHLQLQEVPLAILEAVVAVNTHQTNLRPPLAVLAVEAQVDSKMLRQVLLVQ
jgi:hypothetical protein